MRRTLSFVERVKDKSKQAQPEAGHHGFHSTPQLERFGSQRRAEIESLAGATRAQDSRQTDGPARAVEQDTGGAGGGVGVKLGAESLSYVVVTRSPDGKLSMECVTGDKAAAKTASGK
jgi:hypothetical protein